MRIAITGASGFIGRHVTQAFIDAGYKPVIMLRPCTQIPTGMESLSCIRHDLSDDASGLFELLGSPEILIHLAWSGLPNYRSLHHLDSELPNQFRFLRNMIQEGLPKLVVTGTCFEYGMQYGPLSEEVPARPDNPYGYAKNTLYNMLEMLRQEIVFDLTWARLFYLYGTGQSSSSLYQQLHRAAATGGVSFPMSGGEQLRDFMPINQFRDDFTSLCIKQGSHGIVNLCSGNPISVRSLVEQWIRENNWNILPDLGKYAYPNYEPMAFWGVRKKLDSILYQQ